MKRRTLGVPEGYVPTPEGAARAWAGLVRSYRHRWGSGRLLNEFLNELTVEEILLLTEAVNHGVNPEDLDGYPSLPQP